MSERDNMATVQSAYEAFARGDMDHLSSVFADVQWHVPGSSQISGDKKGWVEIAPFLGTLMELSAGTFKGELRELFGTGDKVVSLHETSAQRPDGAQLESFGVLIWRFEGDAAVEIHEMFSDQYAEDAFWG